LATALIQSGGDCQRMRRAGLVRLAQRDNRGQRETGWACGEEIFGKIFGRRGKTIDR